MVHHTPQLDQGAPFSIMGHSIHMKGTRDLPGECSGDFPPNGNTRYNGVEKLKTLIYVYSMGNAQMKKAQHKDLPLYWY